jgi:5'-nucleotidase
MENLRQSLFASIALGLAVLLPAAGCMDEPSADPLADPPEVERAPRAPALDMHLSPDCADHAEEDDPLLRAVAAQPVTWKAPGALRRRGDVEIKLLGLNDFHGQLESRLVAGRPAGGAAILAAYLRDVGQDFPFRHAIIHAGDHIGASPPESALLQDEPAIQVYNLLGNSQCSYWFRFNPFCNLVGTSGNHEFDEGKDELLRIINGGNHPDGPFLEPNYRGARYPHVSSNVVVEETGDTLFPPLTLKFLGGIPVAFIGAVLESTPTIVTPTGVAGLEFLDEADTINSYVSVLKIFGIRTIVVTIHQGGRQTAFEGPTPAEPSAELAGEIVNIVSRLDDEVDVVVSGHAHGFTNSLLPSSGDEPILVTQAFSSSTAFGDIDLVIDRRTRDVIEKTARIITTFGDVAPGNTPAADVAAIVTAADELTAPLVNRVIAEAAGTLTRTQNAAGESQLGNLIADAQRAAMGTQLGFMNPGGIRADIEGGEVTWGELFTVQPFGNSLVQMNLTGAQVVALLEQQWCCGLNPRILGPSGLTYTWSASQPEGSRIVEVLVDGAPIDPAATYSVTVNSFIAAGGDSFTVLLEGTDQVGGAVDLDALIPYVESLPQPFTAAIEGRITQVP